jgi:hypothetical protein
LCGSFSTTRTTLSPSPGLLAPFLPLHCCSDEELKEALRITNGALHLQVVPFFVKKSPASCKSPCAPSGLIASSSMKPTITACDPKSTSSKCCPQPASCDPKSTSSKCCPQPASRDPRVKRSSKTSQTLLFFMSLHCFRAR